MAILDPSSPSEGNAAVPTCFEQLFNPTVDPSKRLCPASFDAVLCWPETEANSSVYQPCPTFSYENSASLVLIGRRCDGNGSWANFADYSLCRARDIYDYQTPYEHVKTMYVLYWIGYTISLLVCVFALAIFLHYRKLWCLRNMIHSNIILCFTLHNLVWILYSIVNYELDFSERQNLTACLLPSLLLKYFISAAFFWMFVEGLYIFLNILYSFHAQHFKFWMGALIGWVTPGALMIAQIVFDGSGLKAQKCWNWQHDNTDLIIIVPILILILVNMIFLSVVMCVVMNKLKHTVTQESQRYRKGIRALLVLCPLLGVNYVLVFAHPSKPMWLSLVVHYYSVLISSVQGALVALFFCFRNHEVQECLGRSAEHVKLTLKLRADAAKRRSAEMDASRITLLTLHNF